MNLFFLFFCLTFSFSFFNSSSSQSLLTDCFTILRERLEQCGGRLIGTPLLSAPSRNFRKEGFLFSLSLFQAYISCIVPCFSHLLSYFSFYLLIVCRLKISKVKLSIFRGRGEYEARKRDVEKERERDPIAIFPSGAIRRTLCTIMAAWKCRIPYGF